ncbi:MAG: DNA gyrase/topoisomerase IV subunit B [Fimbriimonadaceae bacterium]
MANPANPGDINEPEVKETITGKVENSYEADSIQVLEGLEAVRKRPGMYVGDNGKRGLHQMFREVLDNAVDEALAGYCDTIEVKIFNDGSMSLSDNGRGIPVGLMEKEGLSALTVIMTKLHAGGKFGGGGYKVSGGLHGVGVSCTNALSDWMETTVYRNGKVHRQRFEKGFPKTDVEIIGDSNLTGTLQHWMPDPDVLTHTEYDSHLVKRRLREIAYLNPTVTINFEDERDPEQNESFHFERGIIQLVEDVNEGHTPIHLPISFQRERENMEIDVAFQYTTGYHTNILAYSNNIHQPDGGTHVSGFMQAFTRVVNAYARRTNLLKEKDKNFTSDDIMEGITAVIALKLEDPSYNSQDKVKLVNPEVQGVTHSLVGEGLSTYLDENPSVGKKIVDKASIAQRAREEARKAAEAVKRSSVMDTFGLPGKLSDCMSKNPAECEIFLVEGDSAGGSAKGARDRKTQAVLPLRGKILNVEKARLDKALDNNEVQALIAALGSGIDIETNRALEQAKADEAEQSNGHFDLTKLRYHKIIIMTDADVDGEHIRTLLLTFFYRYMKPLIKEGYVYMAQPPLFVIKVGSNERIYAMTETERDEILRDLRQRRKKFTVGRFKGLGEMRADELEETTMDPATRKLLRIDYDPEFEMEVEQLFSRLMGDKVEPRREFIEAHAKSVTNVDWHY